MLLQTSVERKSVCSAGFNFTHKRTKTSRKKKRPKTKRRTDGTAGVKMSTGRKDAKTPRKMQTDHRTIKNFMWWFRLSWRSQSSEGPQDPLKPGCGSGRTFYTSFMFFSSSFISAFLQNVQVRCRLCFHLQVRKIKVWSEMNFRKTNMMEIRWKEIFMKP